MKEFSTEENLRCQYLKKKPIKTISHKNTVLYLGGENPHAINILKMKNCNLRARYREAWPEQTTTYFFSQQNREAFGDLKESCLKGLVVLFLVRQNEFGV